jgi:hypothetical protein
MTAEPLATTAGPVDDSESAVALRNAWVKGYEYALKNLDDEGVRADAARLGVVASGGTS